MLAERFFASERELCSKGFVYVVQTFGERANDVSSVKREEVKLLTTDVHLCHWTYLFSFTAATARYTGSDKLHVDKNLLNSLYDDVPTNSAFRHGQTRATSHFACREFGNFPAWEFQA